MFYKPETIDAMKYRSTSDATQQSLIEVHWPVTKIKIQTTLNATKFISVW